jgi:cation:H+ antiporter
MAVVTNEVVTASTQLIAQLPISASLFGVVILGVSTSLPELSTTLVSMFKGKRDILVGILLGSNITDPLLGLGLGAMVSTYTVPDVIVLYDLPVNVATAVLLYVFLYRYKDLSKTNALVLMGMFFGYLYLRLLLVPGDVYGLPG